MRSTFGLVVLLAATLHAAPPPGVPWTLHGTVTGVQPNVGRLAVRVESVEAAGGELRQLEPPVETSLLCGRNGAVRLCLQSGQHLPATALAPGMTVDAAVRAPWLGGLLALDRVDVTSELPEAPAAEAPAAADPAEVLDPDGVSPARVTVPMVFPAVGKASWEDTFLASRDGGKRRHHGQDVICPKLTPCVAVFDGTVWFERKPGPNASNSLTLRGANGWTAWYLHLNNDTPGTDDGRGSPDQCFPPWLQPGDKVVAGQLIAWSGDSGNAEETVPHLHFELHRTANDGVINAAPSLAAARKLTEPCLPPTATLLRPKPGEVLLEGTVSDVDPPRQVLQLVLQSRTKDGKRTAPRQPEHAYLRCGTAELALAALPEHPWRFADLAPGVFISAVGKDLGTSLEARLIHADVSAVVPGEGLAAVFAGQPGAS